MRGVRAAFQSDDGSISEWRLLDHMGHVLARAEAARSFRDTENVRDFLVLVGPSTLVTSLALPGVTAAQDLALAAAQLSNELASPRQDLVFALGPSEGDGTLVMAIDRRRLEANVESARSAGLDPEVVVPISLLLSPPSDFDVLKASIGNQVLLRGRGLATVCEPDLAERMTIGRTSRLVDKAAEFDSLVNQGLVATTANLIARRPAMLGGKVSLRSLRRAGVIVALALASPVIVDAAALARNEVTTALVASKSRTIAKMALPRAASITNPSAQLREHLADVDGSRRLISAAAALQTAVSRIGSARVVTLFLGDEGEIGAAVEVADYSQVDLLVRLLGEAGSRATVEGTGASEEGAGVVVDLRLDPD